MDQLKPTIGRRGYLALFTIITVVAVSAIAIPAMAVNNTGLFELEGNAVSQATDDWDRVCHQVTAGGFDSAGHATGALCTSASNTTGAGAVEFVHASSQNEVNFTGGGSKDPIDISSWAYTTGTGGNPAKDILLDGFAARYSKPSTGTSGTCPTLTGTGICKLIYFGLDRFDNSGDAQNGFWFLQNKVTLANNKVGGGQGFSGVHKAGDVLVVTDFSSGGGTSTISVYHWDPTCTKTTGSTAGFCGDQNLRIDFASANANCTTTAQETPACGIVNQADGSTGPNTSPWGFLDKSGNTTYAQGELFEAGINISNIQGLNANACFSSTLAESRSSTSTSAVLKVFILGGFGECTSKTVTTPSAGQNGTVQIPANATLTESDSATITVQGTSVFGGTVKFSLCGPLALGTTSNCASGGVQIGGLKTVSGNDGSATVASDNATITKVGRYCWRAEYSGDPDVGVPPSSDPKDANDTSVSECFSVTPRTPTLTTLASITNNGFVPASISDTATLSNTANRPGSGGLSDGSINPTTAGSPAQGTITFNAYGPNNCTSLVGTSTAAVNGDGTYSSASITVNVPGTYTFVASYPGDGPNTLAASPTGCPDGSGTEAVTAKDTSSASSLQNWIPNDSGSVSSGSGQANLTGTLTLQLYESSDCSTGAVNGQFYTKTITGVSSASIASTNTGAYTVSGDGAHTVSWKVTFTSSDGNVSGSSHCETSTVTIANNN